MGIQEKLNQFRSITPLSQAMNEYQNELNKLIEEWQVPEDVKNAALFLPWIGQISDADLQHKELLAPDVVNLLLEWHELYQLTIVPPIGGYFQGDVRSLKLRRLIRLAYLNIPLVLLTVMDHTARIRACLPETETDNFWEDTKEIFLPLLNMLGMWELRREWIERTFQQLKNTEFSVLEKRLARNGHNQQKYVDYVQSEIDKWFPREKSFHCMLRQPTAGRVIYRSQRGESQEELSDMATVSIIAPTESACYQALEFVHTLGVPIQGRFSDYLAAPNANGYRALHTSIIGNKKNKYGRYKIIVFRIFTQTMNEMNMWGIIKGLYQDPKQYGNLPVWWQAQTNGKALELVRDYKIGDSPKGEESLIYVFTPHGEVKVLSKGSAALDFAYNLHTKVGHHCRSVQVNGEEVAHSTELQNGDLVLLNHDPLFQGPDPAWLHIANSESTRTKIKQGLRSIRQANHPGRQHIDQYLEALRKDSDFIVPEPQLEKYFMLVVEELGLRNMNSLFDAIIPASQHGKSNLAAEKIISFILGAELTTAVVDNEGNPIVSKKLLKPSFSRPFLRFCPNCKPAPGSALILHRRKRGGHEKLTLHRRPQEKDERHQGDEKLFGLPASNRLVCLSNIDPSELKEDVKWGNVNLGRVAANVTIVAQDRSHLVGDLLFPIYDNDRVTLTHIQATTDPENTADILFMIEGDTKEQITNLTEKLRKVSAVREVSVWPVTLSQSAHYKTRYTDHLEIPYTPGPVRDYRMLFGREEQKKQIRRSLRGDNPQRLIIIRGQRRAGKTSLAMLSRKFLPPNIRTVYVDLLQVRRNPTTPKIYEIIIEEIYNSLRKTISADIPEAQYQPPKFDELEERPRETFFAYLRRIQDLLAPHRLLLILDEFNMLVADCKDDSFFYELRSLIIGNFPNISLMLITHANQLDTISSAHPVRSVYEQSEMPIDLPTLDQASAKDLIEKPLANLIQYNEHVVNQLVNFTHGHPYLINLLCREIVHNVFFNEGRRYVRAEDLATAVRALMRNGGHSFHFAAERVDDQARSLVAQIAAKQNKTHDWVNLLDAAETANISYDQARQITFSLNKYDILNYRESGTDHSLQVKFIIDYFCQWVYRNWR